MQTVTRRVLIAAALGATLAAVWWLPDDATPDADQRPPSPAAAPRSAEADLAALPAELARAPLTTEGAADAFAMRSWRPPPPPPPKVKPPAPTAPPLPYTYLGKLVEGEAIIVFLARAGQNVTVRVGDRVDGQYRIDAVSESALELTYLPLDQKQTLSLPRPN